MAHINELVDYTVEVFVVFNNKVLLRWHDKYNIWLSVGGHIELDEDPNEAAIREVKEEVGLDIELDDSLRQYEEESEDYKELIPPYFMNIHKISETHRHLTLTYFAKANSDEIVESDDEKSEKWEWMSKEDLEKAKDLKPSVKFYALKALEEINKTNL